jgi:hypothetical protein
MVLVSEPAGGEWAEVIERHAKKYSDCDNECFVLALAQKRGKSDQAKGCEKDVLGKIQDGIKGGIMRPIMGGCPDGMEISESSKIAKISFVCVNVT